MRAALADRMPALSYHFGIRPWEVDDLTRRELGHYLAALDQVEADTRQAQERMS